MLGLLTRWLAPIMLCLTACQTIPIATPADIESAPTAVTVPYRLSSAGRMIVDISVNNASPAPFVIDTGATMSVIYDAEASQRGLIPTDQTVLVRGLVSVGRRPVTRNAVFKIGGRNFDMERIAVLKKPEISDQVIGLLGSDLLSDQIIVLNNETMTATFVPNEDVDSKAFKGWRKITLHGQTKGVPNVGLHFAKIKVGDQIVPILFDTGANLNFINWDFATMDDDIRQLEIDLLKAGELQGALNTTSLTRATILNDFSIGRQYWPKVPVTIIELDPLSTVAPVEQPMMIAGANLFTPWTFAIDLSEDVIYIRPNQNEPKPPIRSRIFR